jgi:transcriptional regulator with XRE-family HTH domain
MKYSDYKKQLEQNLEYQAAKAEVQLAFNLGNAVLRARLKKGWTQSELARRVGTKQANISRIEAGLANPTLELIRKVCKALDIEINFQKPEDTPTSYTVSIVVDTYGDEKNSNIRKDWFHTAGFWSKGISTTSTKKEVVHQ